MKRQRSKRESGISSGVEVWGVELKYFHFLFCDLGRGGVISTKPEVTVERLYPRLCW